MFPYSYNENIWTRSPKGVSSMTTKSTVYAGLKKEYDIALSKKLCPPVISSLGQKHLKRIVVHVDDIIILDEVTGSLQPRESVNIASNVAELIPSFRYNGWLHDQRPLSVEPSKAVKGKFLLRRGFNRFETMCNKLGWRYVIVDKRLPVRDY